MTPAILPFTLSKKRFSTAVAVHIGRVEPHKGLFRPYELEGHVVPYMIVVKVGKPTQHTKHGNRWTLLVDPVDFNAQMSPMASVDWRMRLPLTGSHPVGGLQASAGMVVYILLYVLVPTDLLLY